MGIITFIKPIMDEMIKNGDFVSLLKMIPKDRLDDDRREEEE